jgi:hypothetical protein
LLLSIGLKKRFGDQMVTTARSAFVIYPFSPHECAETSFFATLTTPHSLHGLLLRSESDNVTASRLESHGAPL